MGDYADTIRPEVGQGIIDAFEIAGKGQAAPSADGPIRLDQPGGPARPEARGGRYYLPDPVTGKTASWQRVTNFIKLTEDTYHLELWKQRCVAVGVAKLAQAGKVSIEILAGLDVKAQKVHINNVASAAMEAYGAYDNATEGTELHKSTETVDYANGRIIAAPERHWEAMQLYRRTLAQHGLTVMPELIERVTVSKRYETAGKFDRILTEADGTRVLADLKTGDSIYDFRSMAAQLDAYRNGINEHGIYDGRGYNRGVKVRDDYALIIHMPSTRPGEITVYRVPLAPGKAINDYNLSVREARRVKVGEDVYVPPVPVAGRSRDEAHAVWTEQICAAHTYEELVLIANDAKAAGEWTSDLSRACKLAAAELKGDF